MPEQPYRPPPALPPASPAAPAAPGLLPLPQTALDWLKVFGPGAIVASMTIGTGELIFSTRGGALFGYSILFVFVAISLLKWGLVLAAARHMVLTGVHPYQRMLDLPGPRGWILLMLLFMAGVCLPIWISFHAGVVGNMTSWITNTRHLFNGGMDYVWGGTMLVAVLVLSATGGYSALERVQMFIVTALLLSAVITLFLYNPDWMEMLAGLMPQRLTYPEWVPEKYPKIAQHSVWVETTRYVGVIGGAGFDYLAYTSWLREKRWGVLPGRATPEQLSDMASDRNHSIRRWVRAPMLDSSISFALIVAFSAVFVASGALILRPNEIVPDEGNLLNLQARFVTDIHAWLLPLYVTGAFLTMAGTLYGTIEVGVSIVDEILRSFVQKWDDDLARRWRRLVIFWCALFSMAILCWLFVRQSGAADAVAANNVVTDAAAAVEPDDETLVVVEKPRVLLALLTPANLFTGVLSCALICFLNLWMDRKYLPAGLRMPFWLMLLNLVAGVLLLLLGMKGYWDHHDPTGPYFARRWFPIGGLCGIAIVALTVARFLETRRRADD